MGFWMLSIGGGGAAWCSTATRFGADGDDIVRDGMDPARVAVEVLVVGILILRMAVCRRTVAA
jgi:hypothetical protein